MSFYPPPVDNYPIFDALAFLEPLNTSITQSDADARYLARTGTASSSAVATIFSGDISSKNAVINNTDANSGLNGLSITQGAMFGRNDITANSFNGVLGYTRHPIGWTISVSKAVAIPTSNVPVDVISTGTPTTVFNTLSNGVWRISCSCNNSAGLGAMTYAVMGWGAPTGATILNGTTAQLFHQTTSGLSNMGLPYPDLILRTTGNGVTGLVCNFTATYSVQPIVTFNLFAIKIG